MGFGRAGVYFWYELLGRLRLGYWARGSGPWAVRASKKSARAISLTYQRCPDFTCQNPNPIQIR